MTLARDDRYLLCMVGNVRTASSRHMSSRWYTATGVLMLAWLRQIVDVCFTVDFMPGCLHTEPPPLTANHRQLRLQWAHEYRAL
ncbi:hypothetical protein TNCV_2772461 [Trichonephila clavipes]|nr:hypothetical protein TNCV_2772461 [Trichonephila clavipes]